MPVFKFVIPNKKLVIYQVLAYCNLLLNALGFLFFDYKTTGSYKLLFIVAISSIILIDFIRYKKTGRFLSIGTLIILCGIFWAARGNYLLCFLDIFLWVLYIISKRRLLIEVAAAGISYPSFPSKTINWRETDNVVLKDDILTIDLKNNKIYQHLIAYINEVNEQEFNEFCRQQIKA